MSILLARSVQRADMCVLFVGRETAVAQIVAPSHLAHDEHVGIVPVTGLGIGIEFGLKLEAYVVEACPGVGDVACGSPGIGVDGLAPFPDFCHTILAEAVEDVAGLLPEEAFHEQIGTDIAGNGLLVGLIPVLSSVATPVVFQVIDAP